MADDQKNRFIQYLAEQHQEDELTIKAMKLVLEDFMDKMKGLEEQTVKLHGTSVWNFIGTFFKNIFNGCRDYVNMVPGKITLATCQC